MGGGDLNGIWHELGQLKGSTESLEGWVAAISRDVEAIKADAAERKGLLERVVEKLETIGSAVAHLNDVDRKLLEVGLRLDDAKGHRQDQLTLRRIRRFLEAVWRHAGRLVVAGAVIAIAGVALRGYPAAWHYVEPILEHLIE